MLQGVPVGLCFGSIPFLLKSKLSFGDLAIFSLAGYPYSLKLAWSPIVDSVYWKTLGRRKSWILPIQLLTGCLFLWLGANIDLLVERSQESKRDLYILSGTFFTLIFLCATQDIAVDGWALTLLSKENVSYASTAQTIGLDAGYFLSFTIFLSLNSVEFSNKYLRSVPQDYGVLSLSAYLLFWGYIYLLVTSVLIFKKENDNSQEVKVHLKEAYQQLWDLVKLPQMKQLIMVLLICKLGFITNDAVTGLKLLEKGFQKEDLALTVLIDFPLQIILSYFAAKWSRGENPLFPWMSAFVGRTVMAAVGMGLVFYFPKEVTGNFLLIVVLSTVFSSFMSTIQFVSLCSFFNRIADPTIGGTYMTVLNTLSNFGGTWPKFFVLEAVDYFSRSPCLIDGVPSPDYNCVYMKQQCEANQGTCVMERDGYYIVNISMVVLGTLLFFGFIYGTMKKIQRVPMKEWLLNPTLKAS